MVNYTNGKIYKLVNNVDDKVYVGSTCNPLHKRKDQHKRRSSLDPERPVYKHLNGVGWEHVEIILVENFPCTSKDELNKKERYWIEQLNPPLNRQIPTRSDKEYRDSHKEESRSYRERHKEELKLGLQKYREAHHEELLDKAKDYRESHSEEIKDRRKTWYESNKARVNERRRKDAKAKKENALFVAEYKDFDL